MACRESGQLESQKTGKVLAAIAAAGIGAVIILAMIVTVVNRTPTINLNDYLYFETEGYDGYGSVTAEIDWDSIKEKYRNKISDTREGDPVDMLDAYIGINLEIDGDKQGRFSNGDEISYTWDMGATQLNQIKCKFEYTDGTYRVSGLQELGSFDPFEDIELVFSGVESEGNVELVLNGEKIPETYISCDREDGLSNGDRVKVMIHEDGVDYAAQHHGMIPDPLEKEYEVRGLDSYVTSAAQISREDMKALREKADSICREQVADSWEEGEQLESFTYIGNYLLSRKEGEQRGTDKNQLWMIYRVNVRNQYANDTSFYDDTNTFYFYVRFCDLVVTDDGTLNVDMDQWNIPKDQVEVRVSALNKSWYYYGYVTLETLYQDGIQNSLEAYNCENNVDETSGQPEVTGDAPETDI